MSRWLVLALLTVSLHACSKADNGPQVFLPRILSPDGRDLDALRLRACGNGSQIDLRDKIITPENFRNIFTCANYDSSLSDLEPLFNSPAFPELITSINLVMKAGSTKELKDTLKDWLQEGPQGTSRIDRLLPFLASLIKNPSFQDFLPVFDGILQAGRAVWNDLLPGLADVVYTDLFPDNVENAFVIVGSMTGSGESKDDGDKDYATPIKDFMRFMMSDLGGKSVSFRVLELLKEVENLQPAGTSLYQMIEHMLEKGTISAYFLDSGSIRGEKVDQTVNELPDDAAEACEGLNETPEQRQECARLRLFRRGNDGSDAPIVQLAALVTELQKDHKDFVPSLTTWIGEPANAKRVVNSLHGFVIRFQVGTRLGGVNAAAHLESYAKKQGIDLNSPVSSDRFSDIIRAAFADASFKTYLEGAVSQVNFAAYGERNQRLLQGSAIPGEIMALYGVPEIALFAKEVINGADMPLNRAIRLFGNKHRLDNFSVTYNGKNQSVDKHLSDIWHTAVSATLGEDIVLEYVMSLLQSLAVEIGDQFKNDEKPLAEWFFNSPYGNPAMTESLVSFGLRRLDVIGRHKRHKEWLKNEFATEVFSSEDDRRAFRMVIDQVPNFLIYVRSGMARSGGDLTRAFARDRDGFLVRSYVNLIVKATETGWLSKGVRLLQAWQDRPGKITRARAFTVSDEIPDRRKYKMGVEAMERILRSLIQPEREGDYSTATLSRLVTPLSSIVSDERREETEKFLLTSAKQVNDLTDKEINDFMKDLNKAKPPGSVSERRETFRATSDLLRDPNFPAVVRSLTTLFQDRAVKPALKFLQEKIDDGTLPKVLLMIRRLLGFAA